MQSESFMEPAAEHSSSLFPPRRITCTFVFTVDFFL